MNEVNEWGFMPHSAHNYRLNEMNRALDHLCAHIGQTGPGEPSEDGEMNEMAIID